MLYYNADELCLAARSVMAGKKFNNQMSDEYIVQGDGS